MNSKLKSNNLLFILFTLSIFLLVSHLVLTLIYPEHDEQIISALSNQEIEKIFLESLSSFAIRDEWIKPVKNKTEIPAYKINVPSDLPMTQILFELTKQFNDYNLSVTADEMKINGKTQMQISSVDDVKLKADFIYNSGIQRTESKSSIFIFGRENKGAEYDSLMYLLSREISSLLIPSKSNAAYSKWLLENGFDYAVMLNNDVVDLEFKIGNDFSETRLKLIVQNLVVSFPRALFYVVDKKSNLFSSPRYLFIKNEFDRRKIRFFTTDSLKILDGDRTNLSERFNTAVKNFQQGKMYWLALSYDAFLILNDDIRKLVKVGYKFVKPSQLNVTKNK